MNDTDTRTTTPMMAKRLEMQNNGYGKKRYPHKLTEEQILQAAEQVFSETIGSGATISARDIYRVTKVQQNVSTTHDIRRALLKNGYIEHQRVTSSYYTRPPKEEA